MDVCVQHESYIKKLGFFQILLLLYESWQWSQVRFGMNPISNDFIIKNTLQNP